MCVCVCERERDDEEGDREEDKKEEEVSAECGLLSVSGVVLHKVLGLLC